MLKVLILLCPGALDPSACNEHTALDIVRTIPVSTPQQCGFMGQTAAAATSQLPPGAPRPFFKILCRRATEASR